MSDNTNISFNELLNELTTLTNTFVIDVKIPSLNQTVQFKELNTRQQKKLLETVTDTSVYKTEFSKVFLDIVKENLITENINADDFTIYDKIAIGLFLRSKISKSLNVIFNESPVHTENIDISPIIEKIKAYIHPVSESFNIFKNDSVLNVELTVPSISLDAKYESEITKTTKKMENIKNINEMGTVLSDVFIGEVSKFISKITFNSQEIDFKNFTINQRIKFCEVLTADLTQNILEKISDWKKTLDDIIEVSSTEGNYKKIISLDNLLFLM
jgi:hypothetical protein